MAKLTIKPFTRQPDAKAYFDRVVSWTLEYSKDGTAWTKAPESMKVTEKPVFVGVEYVFEYVAGSDGSYRVSLNFGQTISSYSKTDDTKTSDATSASCAFTSSEGHIVTLNWDVSNSGIRQSKPLNPKEVDVEKSEKLGVTVYKNPVVSVDSFKTAEDALTWKMVTQSLKDDSVYIDPTLTLRPNADGTYSQLTELTSSSQVYAGQFESGDLIGWSGSSGTPAIVASPVHHGTYAVQTDASAEYCYNVVSAPSLYTRVYISFSAMPGATNQYCYVLGYVSTGVNHMLVGLHNDGTDVVWRMLYRSAGGPLVVYSTQQKNPSINTWYCLCIHAKMSSADGSLDGEYHVYVNGKELTDIAKTGIDTDYTSFTNARVGFNTLSGYSSQATIDCVVMSTAYIGVEARCNLVNDQSDNTGLTVTRFSSETVAYSGRKETENLADSGQTTPTINSVTAYTRAKTDGSTADKFVFLMRMGVSETESAEIALTTSIAEYSVAISDPDGGTWSWADIDALKLGSRASTLASGKTETFTEYWIVVDYTVSAGTKFSGGSVVAQMMASSMRMLRKDFAPKFPRFAPRCVI